MYSILGNILLIVGGQSAEKTEDKAYALSLDPSVEIPSCLRSISSFPYSVYSASTAIFDDGKPTICGGRIEFPLNRTKGYYEDCYKLNFTNEWEYSGFKNVLQVHTGKYFTLGDKCQKYIHEK